MMSASWFLASTSTEHVRQHEGPAHPSSVSELGLEVCPQGLVTSLCGSYLNLQVVELFVDPIVNLGSPNE
jgi:hypothetical protein